MTNAPAWLPFLGIYLITFNRAVALENTLRQLAESPLAACHMMILDNCSTDSTPQVIEKYSPRFSNITVIRHGRNIGGDYNFLRAVEMAHYKYTWILCDDDDYDFTDIDTVFAAIESGVTDLIYVASRSPVQLGWAGHGQTTVGKLIREGGRFHRAAAFWPSLIFRSSLFDESVFTLAPHIFPSFKFMNKCFQDDVSILVLENPIILRSELGMSEVRPLAMYARWVLNAAAIKDRKVRQSVILQWTDKGFLRTLCFWIALEKAKRVDQFWSLILCIFLFLTPMLKIQFIILLPVMVVPIPVDLLLRARVLVYRWMGRRNSDELPPVDFRNRV